MPSLEDMLKKKSITIEENKFVHKPYGIATGDRPYSSADSESLQLIKTESNVEIIQQKLEPKLSQTEDKLKSKLSQTRAKVEPSPEQLEPNLSQTEAKLETKLRPKLSQKNLIIPRNNLSQTRAKVEPSKEFLLLVGLQKQITIFLFEECQSALAEETSGLTIDYISMSCNTTKSAARKALQRLEKKKIIIRSDFKNGRAGWTRYKLPDVIYQEIHHLKSLNKLEPKLSQIEVRRLINLSQTEAKLRTELEPSPSSSSSFLNSKETTTTDLGEEWNFDISDYEDKFGFTYSQIKTLAKIGKLPASDVEQSLIEFSYDLDNDKLPPIKTSKLNYLMGPLRSGTPYTSGGYRDEQQALISEMARRAQEKRKQLAEDKFVLWETSLSDQERKEIESKIPLALRVMFKSHGVSSPEVKNFLFNYYLKQPSDGGKTDGL